MKIEGKGELRTPNPANPLKPEVKKEKQLTYYVDLDSTLAYYDTWGNMGAIGEPIPLMKKWIFHWLKNGIKIKIFTARACKPELIPHIKKWLLFNGFPLFEITNIKGLDCDMIFDNNCREVIYNTGMIISHCGEFKLSELNK